MLGDFPTNQPDLLRALSRFYFQALFHMSYNQGDKYVRDLHYILKKRPHSDVANLLYTRSWNLFLKPIRDSATLIYCGCGKNSSFAMNASQVRAVGSAPSSMPIWEICLGKPCATMIPANRGLTAEK